MIRNELLPLAENLNTDAAPVFLEPCGRHLANSLRRTRREQELRRLADALGAYKSCGRHAPPRIEDVFRQLGVAVNIRVNANDGYIAIATEDADTRLRHWVVAAFFRRQRMVLPTVTNRALLPRSDSDNREPALTKLRANIADVTSHASPPIRHRP